jgi:hypothetical protein
MSANADVLRLGPNRDVKPIHPARNLRLHCRPPSWGSETLQRCCLVSKSWVPCTRKHLFREIRIVSAADPEAWKKAFPDPVNSPACYTHSLTVGSTQVIAITGTEWGGWIRAFCNVVRLQIWGGMRNLHLRSLPQLLNGFQLSPCSL